MKKSKAIRAREIIVKAVDEDYDPSDPELTDEEALDIILNGLIQ